MGILKRKFTEILVQERFDFEANVDGLVQQLSDLQIIHSNKLIIKYDSGWYEDDGHYNIYECVPETDEELAKRQKTNDKRIIKARATRARNKQKKIDEDFQKYLKLKEKFGK